MCELHRASGVPEGEAPAQRGLVDFIEELVVAVTNGRVYGMSHRRVVTSISKLVNELQELLVAFAQGELVIGAAHGFLFYDGHPLLGASLAAPRLIEPLASMGAGGLAFRAGATEDDFTPVIELLSKVRRESSELSEFNQILESQHCQAIRFLPPYSPGGAGQGTTPADQLLAGLGGLVGGVEDKSHVHRESPSLFNLDIPVRLYQSVVNHLQDVMVDVYRGDVIQLDETKSYVERILEQMTSSPRSVLSIGRYEQYDAYTFGHSIRVCFLALNFARNLTDDTELLQKIGSAALLHDVGKAWVPFEILHSTARLTDAERLEMNEHTTYGADILIGMGGADPMTVATAYGHHLMESGGGYPRTLTQMRVSTATRIVKLCDVYEALTAVRPYKDRMSPLRAYRIMMSMKNHFDPALLRKFINVNGLYPVGSRVLLNSGEIARVELQSDRFDAPLVEIEVAREGEALENEERKMVDLSAQPRGEGLQVQEILLSAEMN